MRYPSLLILVPCAGLLAAPGDPDPHYDAGGRHLTFARIGAAVRTADGSLVLAGSSPVTPQRSLSLYRVLPDGRLDPSFGTNTGFSGIGGAPVLCDTGIGRILVGKAFGDPTTPAGQGVVAVDLAGRLDPSFHLAPEIRFPGAVSCLAVQGDGRVLIGRLINGGTSEHRVPLLYRVMANGGMDPSWQFDLGASNGPMAVRVVLPLENGKLLVGGRFLLSGEDRARSLVRLLEDGRIDRTFQEPDAVNQGEVIALTRLPEGVAALVGGLAGFVVRLDSGGETDSAFANWRGRPSIGSPSALVPAPGGVTVGGLDGVATLEWAGNPQPSPWLKIRPTGTGVASLIREPEGDLIIAGAFSQAGNRWRPGIVKVSANGDPRPNFARGGPMASTIQGTDPGLTRALLMPDARGRLLVAGRFTQYNGELRPGLARLDPDGSLDLAFIPELPTNAHPVALAHASDGDVLVGLAIPRLPEGAAPLIKLRNANGRQDRSFAADLGQTPSVVRIGVASNGWIYVERRTSEEGGRMVRLLPDGSRDRGFTASGQPRLQTVYSDGRVLVRDGQVLRRLLPTGQPDPSFAELPAAQVASLTLLPDDSILAAGALFEGPWMAARWFSDGRRDTSFQPPKGTAARAFAGPLGRVLLMGSSLGELARCLPRGELEAGFRIPRGSGLMFEPVVHGNWLYSVAQGGRAGVDTAVERIERFDVSAFDFAITGLGEAETTLQRMAPRGRQYVLEESLDLHAWDPIATNTVPPENAITWKVPRPPGTSGQYFRTTELPSP